MRLRSTLIPATLLSTVLAAPAWAGLDVTRMTTVVDDFQGSYTVTTTARHDEGAIEGVAQAEFSNFHPREEGATLTGTLMDEFERGPGGAESTATAELTVTGPDPETGQDRTLAVAFEGLHIERNPDGVELSGQVSVNGELFDAGALPPGVRGLLRRVFRMIRH